MINSIKIKNFRSIVECNVSLSPLQVIVGANASGKSNLIKAIEFLSDAAKIGLNDAVNMRGGYNEIIPKMHSSPMGVETSFEINFNLSSPNDWPKEVKDKNLNCHYKLSFKKTGKAKVKIIEERLDIFNVLNFGYARYINTEAKDIEPYHESESMLTIERRGTKLRYSASFEKDKYNLRLLYYWLGINLFNEGELNKTIIDDIFKRLLNGFSNNNERLKNELIISHIRPLFTFSRHFTEILDFFLHIRRYDFLLNELRYEQSISRSLKLNLHGSNISSSIRLLAENNKESFLRILTTMENIIPSFGNVFSDNLRAGKEFLVFEEIFGGRKIESWESSDGTLRALAVLLALETQEEGATIMIEEPEHGLHPWAIKEIVSHMRDSIERKRVQIIITTHSQQVLECLKREELLICERDNAGSNFSTIQDIAPDSQFTMGQVGELWVRGLLKGVPTV